MAYRRTARVLERLAGRREDILAVARDVAAEQGVAAVQIAPVAARAGIAAGTVYRYFPGKADLVATLLDAISVHELRSLRAAADAAPGPLSALAAGIVTLAARALRRPRLLVALADPVEGGGPHSSRRALAAELASRIEAAAAAGLIPRQDAELGASAILGALVEIVRPCADEEAAKRKTRAQALALFALRALGVGDARARGLIVLAPWREEEPPEPVSF